MKERGTRGGEGSYNYKYTLLKNPNKASYNAFEKDISVVNVYFGKSTTIGRKSF